MKQRREEEERKQQTNIMENEKVETGGLKKEFESTC